jgi:hypothetical protein
MTLAPYAAAPALETAAYALANQKRDVGLQLLERVLQRTPSWSDAVFTLLELNAVPSAEALERVVSDSEHARRYMRWLMKRSRDADAEDVWAHLVASGAVEQKIATEYAELLVQRRKPAEAWAVWRQAAGVTHSASELVFNGGFEADFVPTRFDWRVSRKDGVAVGLDTDVRYSGGRSLRVVFDGTANVSDVGIAQLLYLSGGRYRLRAYMRTEHLSTDRGVTLSVVSDRSARDVYAVSAELRGTRDWTPTDEEFDVPAEGGLVRLTIGRPRSFRFDSMVEGTAWFDAVSITPVPPA